MEGHNRITNNRTDEQWPLAVASYLKAASEFVAVAAITTSCSYLPRVLFVTICNMYVEVRQSKMRKRVFLTLKRRF